MGCSRARFAEFFWLSLAFLGACSRQPEISARDAADANDTGRMLGPTDEDERALLSQLATLPSGTARRVGAATVLAGEPYAAASGRTCRALHLKVANAQRERKRVACSNGKAWFFVPDVFVNNP